MFLLYLIFWRDRKSSVSYSYFILSSLSTEVLSLASRETPEARRLLRCRLL